MRFEKAENWSALIYLFLGAFLLVFTFFAAYGFLVGSLTILASADLTELFGRALAPLIEAIIRILFLGVMGWIGSIVTIRAVQLLKKDKEPATMQQQSKPETKQSNPQPAPAAKPETKQQVEETRTPESPKAAPTETTVSAQTSPSDTPAK